MTSVYREHSLPEIFTPAEIAKAARVPVGRVLDLIANGTIEPVTPPSAVGGVFIAFDEALSATRKLAAEPAQPRPTATTAAAELPPSALYGRRDLFSEPAAAARVRAVPAAFSVATHCGSIAALVVVSSLGLSPLASERFEDLPQKDAQMRLVFLATPGPGGGGGGGGLRQLAPPPRAERKGPRRISSPLPVREEPKPIQPVEQPKPEPPRELEAEPLPPIIAPVVTAPGNQRDRIGVLEETTADTNSRGSGTGGGVGDGQGTGIGSGDGSGIGPGSGGGTGGGPYRPGSGIAPPRLLREVKPDYTEEARRRNIEGDVMLEIVVRSDGGVGDVKIVQGIGAGLNERAVQAVRQWRFAPARRFGQPVAVVVEIAVQFRLR